MDGFLALLLSILAINLVITLVVIFIMIKRYWTTQIRAVQILIGFFALDGINRIIEIVTLFVLGFDYESLYSNIDLIFPTIFSGLGIIGAGVFLIFIDLYEDEKVPNIHIAVFVALFTAFITQSFLKHYNTSMGHDFASPNLSPTPLSFEFIPGIMISYLLVVAYPKLWIILRNATDPDKRRSIRQLMISLFFLFMTPAIFITTGNLGEFTLKTELVLTTILPRIGIFVGTLFLLLTYGRSSPAFLQNQTLEKLLVITKAGVPLYSLDFGDNTAKRDDVLISGSLTALSGLLAESIEVTELESIEFKEKEVLIEHHHQIGYFLITDRPSQFLRNALRSTARELSGTYNFDTNESALSEQIIDQETDKKVLVIFGLR